MGFPNFVIVGASDNARMSAVAAVVKVNKLNEIKQHLKHVKQILREASAAFEAAK